MGAIEAVTLETYDERPWLARPYSPALDEDGMMSFLSAAYCRSEAGRRAGASGACENDRKAREIRRWEYQNKTRPIWRWLLEHADVTLMVDPEHPETSIWGWLVTSGPDVIHAIGVKRSVIAAGICRDLVHDMLGDRVRRVQVVTLELPQYRAPRLGWKPHPDWFGFNRPLEWKLDSMWLVAAMAGTR